MLRLFAYKLVFVFWSLALLGGAGLGAGAEGDEAAGGAYPAKLFEGLEYRSLDFSRGGRSTAVAGVVGDSLTYYFGSTGGGVWKTTDAGLTWKNVSDKFFKVGSIGAVAVAESDPNVVYVGTGSACPRGNVSVGDGAYRSTDAGKTWSHIGLERAGQIGRIRVHPKNPDLVYVAVLGQIFGPNEERGVYRSRDGGKSWERSLHISDQTGAVDLSMDPNNPRILYAAMWTARRKPWTLISGSEEGGLYKSADGGDTWKKLEKGLPKAPTGRIGVSVSGADSDRVWALIEAKEGGVFRSDDAGETWNRVNQQANLRQRPWYYTHIFADPRDENTVYVLNTGMYKSTDGGATFQRVGTPHGDNHDLWINPSHPDHMVESNDGGANVSLNGGESWSSQRNQPTAEIYRVTVDNQFPYRVYGAQQDNSTISVSSGGGGFSVVEDWYQVGGCESGHIAVDPRDPDIVYAGCYGGEINRVNLRTRETRDILIYPQLQLGQAPKDLKYRFQWNAPIRLSPHDPNTLYHTSQMVHRSRDEGHSWETISPDLTRDDKSRQDYAGGPITHDSTGVEVYGVIFAFEESPLQPGLLWAGSDDGLVHVSRDGGGKWENVTPAGMPEWGTVNAIELSSHDPGRVLIAVHRYRENDFAPYIFRTNDFGKTWTRIADGTNGIPEGAFVRVVREDPDRKGLLYAGTELGMYVSLDDGLHWQTFQLNLPVTPVTDLAVHRKDLVVATQGRAFWILDDLTPLHQLTPELASAKHHLFEPRDAYRSGFSRASIDFYLEEVPDSGVTLEILDAEGRQIHKIEGKGESDEASDDEEEGPRFGRPPKLTLKKGLNRYPWNLTGQRVETPRGVIVWGPARGARALPGVYQAKLTSGDWSQTQSFEVRLNPNLEVSEADLKAQASLVEQIGERLEAVFKGVKKIRAVRAQVQDIEKRMKDAERTDSEVVEAGKNLLEQLRQVEEKLTQPKSRSGQDPLNFPPMLDNQWVALYRYVSEADARPTQGAVERFEDLKNQTEPLLKQLDEKLSEGVSAYNETVRKKDLGPLILSQ